MQQLISRKAMLVCPWCYERFSSEDSLFVLNKDAPQQLSHVDVLGRGASHKWVLYQPLPQLFPLLTHLHGSGIRCCPRCKSELPSKYGTLATMMIGIMGSKSLVASPDTVPFAALVSSMFGKTTSSKIIDEKRRGTLAVFSPKAHTLYSLQRTACILDKQAFQSEFTKRRRQNFATQMHGFCFVYQLSDAPFLNIRSSNNAAASPEYRIDIPESEAAKRLREMYDDFYLRDDLADEQCPFTVVLNEVERLRNYSSPEYPQKKDKAGLADYHEKTYELLEQIDPMFTERVRFLFPCFKVYLMRDALKAIDALPCRWDREAQIEFNK